MGSRVESALAEHGFVVPEVVAPLASYLPAKQVGNLVFTAGQLPLVDGVLTAVGRVGVDLDEQAAKKAAEVCALNALAAVKSVVGNLDRVTDVVKVVGFVACGPEFTSHPIVMNGASDLLAIAFGDAGKHARSAVGVASLPRNAPVEVEIVVAVSA